MREKLPNVPVGALRVIQNFGACLSTLSTGFLPLMCFTLPSSELYFILRYTHTQLTHTTHTHVHTHVHAATLIWFLDLLPFRNISPTLKLCAVFL